MIRPPFIERCLSSSFPASPSAKETGLLVLAWLAVSSSLFSLEDSAPQKHFVESVRPIIEKHCVSCHGAEQQEGDLRLDSLEGVNRGGKSGTVIVPGSPDESLLIAAVRRIDSALEMPPEDPLSPEDVDRIVQWIADGAVHPDGTITAPPVTPPFDVEVARTHWAFQPVATDPALSSLSTTEAIDELVSRELESAGLDRTRLADRRTLLRRASLTLTGLPPTIESLAKFEADQDPAAFVRVVDRLLATSTYGERWARHWLDVVRYADSNGLDENIAHGNAWRYRNYVVDSFNADKPWDQFLIEQLAGDLLNEEQTPEAIRNERLIATGFLVLGPKVLAEGDETKMQMDIVDEQVDTIGRSMLGLTIGCARCHDHKFDPISQADYYSLAGIFQSTTTMESLKRIARWNENSIATVADTEALRAHEAAIETAQADVGTLLARTSATTVANTDAAAIAAEQEAGLSDDDRAKLATLRDKLKQLEATKPETPTAMGVKDAAITNARILLRGNHLAPGRTVPRGVPVVLTPSTGFTPPATNSGRLELAQWIADDDNPLTARVIVNRVWRWHFGYSLAGATENFGFQEAAPRQLELLDLLTARFIASDWSLKSLHRSILMSNTWQQRCAHSSEIASADSDVARFAGWPLQRMSAETLRDSLLAVSELLDESTGQSLLHVKNREFLFDHTSKDATSYASGKRSIYLPVIRNNLYDAMSLFDCTDGNVPNGDRATTTVASQALFLMNGDLTLRAAEAIARDAIARKDIATIDDFDARLDIIFQRVFQRLPSDHETAACIESLTGRSAGIDPADDDAELAQWTSLSQALLMSNEFIYIE